MYFRFGRLEAEDTDLPYIIIVKNGGVMRKALTSSEITKISPKELLERISTDFDMGIPEMIVTIEDMKKAGELLSKFTAYYNYFMNMVLIMNTYKKELQRAGDKYAAADTAEKEHILSEYAAMCKSNYQAVSRIVTIRQQIMDELKMIGGK